MGGPGAILLQMTRPMRYFGRVLAVCLMVNGLAWAWRGPTNTPPQARARGPFVAGEHYDGKDQNKLKSMLSGTGAEMRSGGQVLLESLHWESYTLEGLTNLIIVGTNCTFNPSQKVVTSPDRLEARSADGRFYIEGIGFEWHQTNSHLVISNQVHTRLRGVEALSPKPNP